MSVTLIEREETDAAASRRALARVAPMIEPLRVGRPRRALGLAVRIGLHVAGSLVIASCVAVMLWNHLGPGPLDVLIGALRTHTGLPLTFAVWLTLGVLMSFAWLLGRRPGLGTVVGPLVVGPTMQLVLSNLERIDAPRWMVVRIAIHLVALGAIGIGAGLVMAARLGWGTGELLAAAASDRSGRPEHRVRMLFEVTWLTIGGLLGGPIGVGTVLVAIGIGPSVARGRRVVAEWLAASRRQISAAYAALPR